MKKWINLNFIGFFENNSVGKITSKVLISAQSF
jgi:hypothetical protein